MAFTQRALRLLFMLPTTCSLRAASQGRTTLDAIATMLGSTHQSVGPMLVLALWNADALGVTVEDLQLAAALC